LSHEHNSEISLQKMPGDGVPTEDTKTQASEAAEKQKVPTLLTKEANAVPEWKSCCFKISPACATFSVQVVFSAFLIIFSAYKLIMIGAPDPLYVSLLTTTVGVWLPSPLHSTSAPPTSQTS
jgi:hypothetical protein